MSLCEWVCVCVCVCVIGVFVRANGCVFIQPSKISCSHDAVSLQLRTAERQMDELRRQAAASREESALYRSEMNRLQDELKSCRCVL